MSINPNLIENQLATPNPADDEIAEFAPQKD